jgi:hypothetical protein
MLDSHGAIPTEAKKPDYRWITHNQVGWLLAMLKLLREIAGQERPRASPSLSIAFQHIPLPDFGDPKPVIQAGPARRAYRRPLPQLRLLPSAQGCGHDHVNEFSRPARLGRQPARPMAVLRGKFRVCGVCSVREKVIPLPRARVWELDTVTRSLKTWDRVQCNEERMGEIYLCRGGDESRHTTAKRLPSHSRLHAVLCYIT